MAFQNRRQFIKTSLAGSFLLCDIAVSGEKVRQNKLFVNSGIGGNTTIDLLSRIDKDCLSYQPDLTLLMIGTNDMNSMKHIPLPQYKENMRLIISKIRSMNSKILLMTILPVYEPYLFARHNKQFYEPEGHKQRLEEMNAVIRKLASEYQLSLLDMYHIFNALGDVGEKESSFIKNMSNSNKTDGVHPTEYGYKIMAVAIYQYIIQSQLLYDRIVCFGDSITANGYPLYLKRLLE